MYNRFCLKIIKWVKNSRIPFCSFIFWGVVFFSILKLFFNKNCEYQNGDKEVVSIIYALVSGFVAVMIPLHYTISLDIIGKIHTRNSNKKKSNDSDNPKLILLYYCHVAEGLIYAFGLFGASVLFEEALVVASMLKYNVPRLWNIIGLIIYAFALIWGLSLNWGFRRQWCFDNKLNKNNKKVNKYKIYHVMTIIISASIGGAWVGLLIASKCCTLNGFGVLVLLTIYYIWWVIFRALFAPMTRVKEMLIDSYK